ncbi:MAG: TonB-dependent receptor, partial [Gammaproteobacteria bacterium]|nr:TonB-dependent receptor [Gammaproteobacteria bacterium]
LTNWELGWKSELLDGRVLFNGAVFFMDVEDQQFSAVSSIDGVPVTLFDNVGESESYGFELDTRAALTDRWSLGAGLALAKHEFTSETLPTDINLVRLFDGGTFKGLTSIGLPRWTGNIRSTYFFPLNADMDVQIDGSVTYQSKTYADAANLAEIKPITRVNLRAALDAGWWEIAVFVRDILDSDKPGSPAISATNSCLYRAQDDGTLFGPTQRCLAVGVDRGREVGASLRFRF